MFEYIISKKWLNITQYNLSNSELNKYKSGIENGTEVTLNFYQILLVIRMKFCKAFANNSSPNIKLSKTQLHEIGQSGEIVGRLLRPWLNTGLPLLKNVLQPLDKRIFAFH